jgi:hypothetical protein
MGMIFLPGSFSISRPQNAAPKHKSKLDNRKTCHDHRRWCCHHPPRLSVRQHGPDRHIVAGHTRTSNGLPIGCESAANLLSRESIKTFQELADEAFRDLLHKYKRPTDLKAALRESANGAVSEPSQALTH